MPFAPLVEVDRNLQPKSLLIQQMVSENQIHTQKSQLISDEYTEEVYWKTIDISSMIIALTSDSSILKLHLLLSDNFGIFKPRASTGIPKVECIVVPFIFTAATPVGASKRTFGFSIHEEP